MGAVGGYRERMDGWMDRQMDGGSPSPGEQIKKQRGGWDRVGGSGSLTEQLYRKDVEGRGERRRQRKRVKRGRGPGRVPLPPPGAMLAPLFLRGGAAGPPYPPCPWCPSPDACGAAGGAPGEAPASPLRAFFWSLRVSEDFFLISWRARLYSGGTAVLSQGTPTNRRSPPRHEPGASRPYLSRGPCPAGWQFSSSPQSCPAKGLSGSP